ncbi:hypothetical protein GCM10022416_39670 [Actinomadura keratinilytica]|uniref:Uncharacterized protein n=1 Tax=Actinomadura keratinilytica TaxID=547461 RepID=A0ABP7Z3S6_9ACTN
MPIGPGRPPRGAVGTDLPIATPSAAGGIRRAGDARVRRG